MVYDVATSRNNFASKSASHKGPAADVTQDAVAGRFKAARLLLGLQKTDVCRETGWTNAYMSKVESGILGLSLPMLGYLLSKEINLNWLQIGEGDERVALIECKVYLSAKEMDEAFSILRRAIR